MEAEGHPGRPFACRSNAAGGPLLPAHVRALSGCESGRVVVSFATGRGSETYRSATPSSRGLANTGAAVDDRGGRLMKRPCDGRTAVRIRTTA